MKSLIIASITTGVILFVCSGIAQQLPWGVPSTQNLSTQADGPDPELEAVVEHLPESSLTTPLFDERMSNKISTLTTDKSFSWIITRPTSEYDLSTFLLHEFFTQMIVGFFLALMLAKTIAWPLRKRLELVAIAALATVCATHLQELNWFGTPLIYSAGVACNLIISWLLASFVVAKGILRSAKQPA